MFGLRRGNFQESFLGLSITTVAISCRGTSVGGEVGGRDPTFSSQLLECEVPMKHPNRDVELMIEFMGFEG